MELEKLISQGNIENIDKESDKRNQINMIDDKKSGERAQVSENKEETLNTDVGVLKLVKLSLQKNKDNIEKEYDEINCIDMSDDKESDEVKMVKKK